MKTIGLLVGSAIGGYIPSLWGADMFSASTIICSAFGAGIGMWIAIRLTRG